MINEQKYIVNGSATEFVGVTTREIEMMTGEEEKEQEEGLMVLSGKMIINVAKCLIFFCTTSFLAPSSFAESLEKQQRIGRRKSKQKITFRYQKATHNVMGAFSDNIEMLYIFHSVSNLCLLLHIALQDMCRHLKRRLEFLLVVSDFY